METMVLEVKHGISDDYEYTEAIKTLRTNLRYRDQGNHVYQLHAG